MPTELSLVSYSLLQSISIRKFMRTASTKLDKREHERLLEMCNDEGKSVAEELREMVKCHVMHRKRENYSTNSNF